MWGSHVARQIIYLQQTAKFYSTMGWIITTRTQDQLLSFELLPRAHRINFWVSKYQIELRVHLRSIEIRLFRFMEANNLSILPVRLELSFNNHSATYQIIIRTDFPKKKNWISWTKRKECTITFVESIVSNSHLQSPFSKWLSIIFLLFQFPYFCTGKF